MLTTVAQATRVVNVDPAPHRRDDRGMSPAQRLVARVDEILKTTTKFRNAQEWASKAKLSRSFLSTLKSRAATGEVRTVKQDAIVALARAAGMSVEDLMGEVPTLPSADGSPGLEAAIADYRWPVAIAADPDRASEILAQLRADAARLAPLPASFWTARLDLLCADHTAESSKLRKKAR